MNTNLIENISNSDLETIFDGSKPFFQLMTYYGCALRSVQSHAAPRPRALCYTNLYRRRLSCAQNRTSRKTTRTR